MLYMIPFSVYIYRVQCCGLRNWKFKDSHWTKLQHYMQYFSSFGKQLYRDEFYVFNGNSLISRNKHTTLRTDSISSILNNYLNRFYSYIVTLSGSNFTSNPARLSFLIECEWLKLLCHLELRAENHSTIG